MKRLIDADAFKQQLQISDGVQIDMYGNILTNVNALNIALERSAIEAEPVRHGKWEMKPDPFGFFDEIPVCSECGCTTKMREKTKYCPNCGCRMDKERK